MTAPQIIDPASVRYYAGGREYRIGMRVETPGGPATVIWFDLDAFCPIIVALDSDASEWCGNASAVIPMEDV